MPRSAPRHQSKLVNIEETDGWSRVVRRDDLNNNSVDDGSKREHRGQSHGIDGLRNTDLLERLTPAQVEEAKRVLLERLQKSQKNASLIDGSIENTEVEKLQQLLERLNPRPATARYSPAELQKRYNWLKKSHENLTAAGGIQWLSGLRKVVENTKSPPESDGNAPGLAKAVCLGLGSPSGDVSLRCHVLWQLIYLQSVIAKLEEDMKIYVQDPVLNDTDQAFLSAMNVTVVNSPQAFALIDASAVVFAPHYSVSAWPRQLRLGQARLVIANDVRTVLDRPETSGGLLGSETVRRILKDLAGGGVEFEMLDGRAREELEQFVGQWQGQDLCLGNGHWEWAFNDMLVYTKKLSDAGG